MRDTKYAREIITATLELEEDNRGCIERIHVKDKRQDEIRFSWWKGGRMMQKPLDLPEEELLALMREAVRVGVFTKGFLSGLRDLLEEPRSRT